MARTRKGNRRSQKKQQKGNFLPFFTGLAVGLFVAFVLYLNSSKPNNITPEEITSSNITPTDPTQKSDNEEIIYDFFETLPERKVTVPNWQPPKPKVSTDNTVVDNGRYFFQIGSFQKHRDADGLKARLALLGFPVVIQRVVINGQEVWFRVRVGPYKDSSKLTSIRQRLSKNKLNSMLVKVNSENQT